MPGTTLRGPIKVRNSKGAVVAQLADANGALPLTVVASGQRALSGGTTVEHTIKWTFAVSGVLTTDTVVVTFLGAYKIGGAPISISPVYYGRVSASGTVEVVALNVAPIGTSAPYDSMSINYMVLR
jgi:hypothetical protein